MRAVGTCLLLLCLFVGAAARADDAAIKAIGGTVAPLTEHPTVRLAAEYVHASVESSKAVVQCVFFLESQDPAADLMIGFPNLSEGADVERIAPFSAFRSYVDGDSIAVTILPDSEHHSYGDYMGWYTKNAYFAAGQRRCIRDIYTGRLGHSAPMGIPMWFDYILWSGSSWAGPIGIADVVLTFNSPEGLPDTTHVTPTGFHMSGNELRWHFTDLEPARGSESGLIHVEWN